MNKSLSAAVIVATFGTPPRCPATEAVRPAALWSATIVPAWWPRVRLERLSSNHLTRPFVILKFI
jgi:hypothetical protein